jgi:hypothetical protein
VAGVFELEAVAAPGEHGLNAVGDGLGFERGRAGGGAADLQVVLADAAAGGAAVLGGKVGPGGVGGDDAAGVVEHSDVGAEGFERGVEQFGVLGDRHLQAAFWRLNAERGVRCWHC